ncbi:MAG: HEPN family nuclease [Methylocella sp.]
MLQILDAEKNNPSITLWELQEKFAAQFGISPTADGFYFYNQHQFLTSLLAYICLPSEKFFSDIPDIEINSLAGGWGLQGVLFAGTLKGLLRHLRNSVAHGHVSISSELMLEFSQGRTVVVFNKLNIHDFCQALAYWCLTKDITLKGL